MFGKYFLPIGDISFHSLNNKVFNFNKLSSLVSFPVIGPAFDVSKNSSPKDTQHSWHPVSPLHDI